MPREKGVRNENPKVKCSYIYNGNRPSRPFYGLIFFEVDYARLCVNQF